MLRIETQIYLIGLLVGLAHVSCGIGVLRAPAALNVTALAGLQHIVNEWGIPVAYAGWGLVGAGVSALLAVALPCSHGWSCVLFLPQQLLLFLMAVTITVATVTGTYPDGYTPAGLGWFINTDQIWAWILAVSHSALLAAYLYGNNRGAGAWRR